MNKEYILPSIIVLVVLILVGYYFFPNINMTGNTVMADKNPKIKILTSEGEIIVELYPEESPKTVENFLSYVDDGFFDGLVFHRVIDNFMIQGGGFAPDGKQKETKDPIALESNNGLKNTKGTIAMARTNNPDSATSQFFINTADNDFLDYSAFNPGYAVFGKVTEGIEIVEKIEKVQTGIKNKMQDWPVNDITIIKVERV